MQIEIRKVDVSDVLLNPDNPRVIFDKEMAYLIKSLHEFPEMMELREIVVDENMVVLGGNMRILALRKSGIKLCIAKIVSGLTSVQKNEFVIKDNSAFGEWNINELKTSWNNLPLDEWGAQLPKDWKGTPDFGPGTIDDQSQLDQKNPVRCTECGYEFIPGIED